MKNLAGNILGSSADAEDAVQETFLKVQRGIGSFRGQSSFVTWTFRVLVNTCYDARRSRLRKKEVRTDDEQQHDDAAPWPEPRATVAHPSLRLALERALATLTRHQRDVFLLYEVEGFHHAEISALLEISEAASKNALFQAKKNLRQMLEPPRSSSAAGARRPGSDFRRWQRVRMGRAREPCGKLRLLCRRASRVEVSQLSGG